MQSLMETFQQYKIQNNLILPNLLNIESQCATYVEECRKALMEILKGNGGFS